MNDYFSIIQYKDKRFCINDKESLDVMPVRLIIIKLLQIKEQNNLENFIFNAYDKAVKLQEAINYNIKYTYFSCENKDLYAKIKNIVDNNHIILTDKKYFDDTADIS